MPVYLCKPGWNSQDPWRHGVQVYAYPFPIDDGTGESGGGGLTEEADDGQRVGAAEEAQHDLSPDSDWFVDGESAMDGVGELLVESGGVGARPSTALDSGAEDLGEEFQGLIVHADHAIMREGGGEDDGEIDGGEMAMGGGDGVEGSSRLLLGGGAVEGREEDCPEEQRLAGTEDARSTDTPAPRTSAFPPDATIPRSSSSSPSGARSGHRSTEQAQASPATPGLVGVAVRRVRHAEVVLVDEVREAYHRYWLRLRWPGPRGGVAGYIALGRVEKLKPMAPLPAPSGLTTGASHVSLDDASNLPQSRALSDGDVASLQSGTPMPAASNQQEEPFLDSKMSANVEDNVGRAGSSPGLVAARSSGGILDGQEQPLQRQPLCESTGLYFPSSATMELLAMYDDGISAPLSSSSAHVPSTEGQPTEPAAARLSDDHVASLPVGNMSLTKHRLGNSGDFTVEPVFCRICREGLHDVNYDRDESAPGPSRALEPTLLLQGGDVVVALPPAQNGRGASEEGDADGDLDDRSGGQRENDGTPGVGTDEQPAQMNEGAGEHQTEAEAAKAAASAIQLHHPFAENPLLAPCECSGSMRFVHYLCVEQWRCRSRHPDARHGLHCETCGAAYTLPPPPSRPVAPDGHDPAGGGAGNPGDEEWLEQMPPHVIAALRQPHLWWQIGAEILRRRWLRPIAPVIMSPIVALYCRARRMLKKRGVSRRRWACSLCRRRARWKCVRCLRSYYCSRQCQNVSWHIVHKHVCYKPSRFWWSVVVYGVGLLAACPGILKDPAVYDLGVGCLRCSFFVMGVIGGGIATVMKRGFGVDVRGRCLEIAVVFMTVWLTLVSWGLVWAFFDDPQRCWGAFSAWKAALRGSVAGMASSHSLGPMVPLVTRFMLRPSKWVLDRVDAAAWKTGPRITNWICSSPAPGEASVSYDTGDGNMTETSTNITQASTKCFRMVRKANPEFFYDEVGGAKCASDMNMILAVWVFAGLVLLASSCLQRRERDRRAARGGGRGVAREERNADFLRPHQD